MQFRPNRMNPVGFTSRKKRASLSASLGPAHPNTTASWFFPMEISSQSRELLTDPLTHINFLHAAEDQCAARCVSPHTGDALASRYSGSEGTVTQVLPRSWFRLLVTRVSCYPPACHKSKQHSGNADRQDGLARRRERERPIATALVRRASVLASDRVRRPSQPHFISPLATLEPMSRATPMPRLGKRASIAAFNPAPSLALASSSSNAMR